MIIIINIINNSVCPATDCDQEFTTRKYLDRHLRWVSSVCLFVCLPVCISVYPSVLPSVCGSGRGWMGVGGGRGVCVHV